jgi:hypothetical protein
MHPCNSPLAMTIGKKREKAGVGEEEKENWG